jgi:DNA repair protein RadA/Sms
MARLRVRQVGAARTVGIRVGAVGDGSAAATMEPANSLLTVAQHRQEWLPVSDEYQWATDLFGGFVEGGSYLLGGTPGAFKSGLAFQVGLDLCRQGMHVLFILTEEPAHRLKERALRMTSQWSKADARRALMNLHVETDLQDIEDLPRFVASHVLGSAGKYHGVKLIVLDSIQGQGISGAATRTYERLYEAGRLLKANGITTINVSHVTKRGQIAGPRALEHNCDCVLLLRKTLAYRMLFVPKNRFGPCALKPLAMELDPISVTLRRSPHVQAMTSVARTYMGNGVGLAEIQASVALSNFGARGKVMAPGLPRRDVEQLVACLSGVEGIEIDDLDFVVHCRLPGARPYQNILGLPLCMALVSSYIQRPIPNNQLHIGEIDLLRTVRDLPPSLVQHLSDAIAGGELPRPLRLVCPPSAAERIPLMDGLEVVPCRRLDDAIFATWPELR